MYAPYGIAIKKDFIFSIRGRNVIYGLIQEKIQLDKNIHWRFEEYIPSEKDFSWLREWRVPIKKINLTVDNCFVITKSKNELHKLVFNEENVIDVEFDGCVSDGQFMGTAIGIVERSFKGISIEDLKELKTMTKAEMEKIINEQNENDIDEIGLGGFVM